MTDTTEHVCPDCAEFERVVNEAGDALLDALDNWLKTQPGKTVPADAVVAAAADLTAEIIAQIGDETSRNAAAYAAIGQILEGSGCDIGSVMAFLRESMAEQMGEAGHA